MLRVEKSIIFDEFTTVIGLPLYDDVKNDDFVKIAGWGFTSVTRFIQCFQTRTTLNSFFQKNNDLPRVLREMQVSIYDPVWCKKKFNLPGKKHLCTKNHMYKGACKVS